MSEEQQEAMRQQYLQQLREEQAIMASQSSDYSTYIQQTAQQASSSAASALDRLQQEDRSPGERPAPARPDFYSNPEVPSVQQLMSTAPKKAGTGSADEAADWLKGVLQERPGGCCCCCCCLVVCVLCDDRIGHSTSAAARSSELSDCNLRHRWC
jgi:hypothetical protein